MLPRTNSSTPDSQRPIVDHSPYNTHTSSTLLRRPILPSPLPLRPLFVITATELSIILTLHIQYRLIPRTRRRPSTTTIARRVRSRSLHNEVAAIEDRILVLLYEVAQRGVARVDELEGREPALVLDARVGPGLEHHVDQRVAELVLRGGLAVDPAHGGVQRRVAFGAGDGVAFEVFLVEEVVDDVVCWGGGTCE